MVIWKIFFQLIATVFQRKPKLTATLLYFTVVSLLYLKQYFFFFQKNSREQVYSLSGQISGERLVTNFSQS